MWKSISVLSSSFQNHLGWHLPELALNQSEHEIQRGVANLHQDKDPSSVRTPSWISKLSDGIYLEVN